MAARGGSKSKRERVAGAAAKRLLNAQQPTLHAIFKATRYNLVFEHKDYSKRIRVSSAYGNKILAMMKSHCALHVKAWKGLIHQLDVTFQGSVGMVGTIFEPAIAITDFECAMDRLAIATAFN